MFLLHREPKRLFDERRLSDFLADRRRHFLDSIEAEEDSFILNVIDTEYLKYKLENALLLPLEIDTDSIQASIRREAIPARFFPVGSDVREGEAYQREVITFHIPFEGTQELILCAPSKRTLNGFYADVAYGRIDFRVINFNDDVSAIEKEKNQFLSFVTAHAQYINSDVEEFNRRIGQDIASTFLARRERILKVRGILGSLGIALIKNESAPKAFAIPFPKQRARISIDKPTVPDSTFVPEPTLPDQSYMQILKLVHDTGRVIERYPGIYSGKREEHLRDHILMILEPNFAGTATGETFNKGGKTDILLRHEGRNAFIAECKFWKGEKSLIDAVSQLLSYLTWRDSKTAIILFVKNADFSTVTTRARGGIRSHPNYIAESAPTDEAWYNFELHLPNDRTRKVKLALMLYHIS